MRTLIALGCGVLFGIGLAVSGMTDPAKVLNFLDVAGSWDPTLAVVMGSALATSSVGYAVARRRERTWLGDIFSLPTRTDIDGSLVGGALLFGIGWGLVGLCPGPALANLSSGSSETLLFVGAMLVGILVYRFSQRE
jgi:uncharacterized membrane protein YedE/YeeE